MHFKCCDAVGWVTGRASTCKKNLTLAVPKVLLLKTYGALALTWSNLWKNRPVKLKPKLTV